MSPLPFTSAGTDGQGHRTAPCRCTPVSLKYSPQAGHVVDFFSLDVENSEDAYSRRWFEKVGGTHVPGVIRTRDEVRQAGPWGVHGRPATP